MTIEEVHLASLEMMKTLFPLMIVIILILVLGVAFTFWSAFKK